MHISATVPLLIAIACLTPMKAANRSSSSTTRLPPASIPLSRTAVTAAISSGPISGRATGIMRIPPVDPATAPARGASRPP